MNSVMSPPATKPPRRRGPRGGRRHNNNNNNSGDQGIANRQGSTNHSNTPRYTPSTAAPPRAQRQLYVPPPHTPSVPKVQILKPSAPPPAPPSPPARPAARTALVIRERQPPPAPLRTCPSSEATVIAAVEDDDGNDKDKSSLPASPPPPASPKPAPAPPPPPPFEAPDHKTLIRERQAQIAAYLSRWDACFTLVSAKGAHAAEPNPGRRLPWTIENNSVDGAGWRPWGEYLHTGHRGT